jgi:hypothetical protein
MDSKTGPATTGSGPRLQATSLEEGSTFPRAAGLITDESGRLIAHGEVRLQNVAGR